jgi:hypothetical protein
VVRINAPTVTLPGGASQPIVTLTSHNAFGQVVRIVDPEKNVHELRYFPSNDPDGNGVTIPGNNDTSLGGYVAESRIDTAVSTPPRTRDAIRAATPRRRASLRSASMIPSGT